MKHILPIHYALVELINDPTLICDHNGIILCANKLMFDLFGYTIEEFTGMNVDNLVPSEIRAKHAQLRESYYDNPRKREFRQVMELKGVTKSGEVIPVDIMLFPTKCTDCELKSNKERDDELSITDAMSKKYIKTIVIITRTDDDPYITKLKELLKKAEDSRKAAAKNNKQETVH